MSQRKKDYGEIIHPPDLLEGLSPNGLLVWKGKFGRAKCQGELILGSTWRPQWGRLLPRKGIHFRVVLLSKQERVREEDIEDPHIVVCTPSRRTRALREEPPPYGGKGEEKGKPPALEGARAYLEGSIITKRGLVIKPAEVFSARGRDEILQRLALRVLGDAMLAYAAAVLDLPQSALEAARLPQHEDSVLEKLGEIKASLPQLRNRLAFLAERLEKPVQDSVTQSMNRLLALTDSRSLLEFYERIKGLYPSPQALGEDISLYKRLRLLDKFIEEAVFIKTYLSGATLREEEEELSVDRASILGQLDTANLLANPHLWPSLRSLFDWFRSRYSSIYLAHHRGFHREVASLRRRLETARSSLAALTRLNSISALGEPMGKGLESRYEELMEKTEVCPAREGEQVSLERVPVCPSCKLPLGAEPPIGEVERFLQELDAALKGQQLHLSSLVVGRILAQPKGEKVDRFLKIVQAGDLSSLGNVLNDEVVDFISGLLNSKPSRLPDLPAQ